MDNDIDWDSILQAGLTKAAESAGAAIGSAIGGPIGGFLAGKLSSALLGNEGDAGQREILNRLAQIELKLEQVILFLQNKLPEIIKTAVTQAFIEESQLRLRAKVSTATQALAIATKKESISYQDVMILMSAATGLSEEGEQMMLRGKEWYLAGLQAYLGASACYAHAIKSDPAYGEGLRKLSERYSGLLSAMIEEHSTEILSYSPVLARLKREFEEAKDIRPAITPGRYLIIVQKAVIGHNTINLPGKSHLNTPSMGWKGTWASFDLEGEKLTQWMDLEYFEKVIENFDPNEELSKFGQPCPWMPTKIIEQPGNISDIQINYPEEVRRRGQLIIDRVNGHPQLISGISNSIATIDKLISACGEIINGPYKAQEIGE